MQFHLSGIPLTIHALVIESKLLHRVDLISSTDTAIITDPAITTDNGNIQVQVPAGKDVTFSIGSGSAISVATMSTALSSHQTTLTGLGASLTAVMGNVTAVTSSLAAETERAAIAEVRM